MVNTLEEFMSDIKKVCRFAASKLLLLFTIIYLDR